MLLQGMASMGVDIVMAGGGGGVKDHEWVHLHIQTIPSVWIPFPWICSLPAAAASQVTSRAEGVTWLAQLPTPPAPSLASSPTPGPAWVTHFTPRTPAPPPPHPHHTMYTDQRRMDLTTTESLPQISRSHSYRTLESGDSRVLNVGSASPTHWESAGTTIEIWKNWENVWDSHQCHCLPN